MGCVRSCSEAWLCFAVALAKDPHEQPGASSGQQSAQEIASSLETAVLGRWKQVCDQKSGHAGSSCMQVCAGSADDSAAVLRFDRC